MSVGSSAVSVPEIVALVLTPVSPLLVASAFLSRRWRRAVVRLAPWATLPALIAAAFSPAGVLELPWLLLGERIGLDEVGRVFLFFTAVVWLLAGVYATHYLAADRNCTRFFLFYLMAMSGNLGLIIAQDVLGFYLFFSLLSFSSYGLIVHKQDREARWAGRVYMYLVVLGEALLFAGLVIGSGRADSLSLEHFAASNQSGLVVGLLLVSFGIKAGALPLHVWLPLAHPVAPTPASAVLSGAMINAGLLGWLRFLPLGQVALPEWGFLCIALGLAAAVYGVLLALCQENAKTTLAYSSISQMGIMTIGVGLGMVAPESWSLCLSAILVYALHHAFAKSALFLGAGVAAAIGGDAIRRGYVFAGLLLPASALAGLPFTSGAVAKFGMAALSTVLPSPWSHVLAVHLSLIAIGTTLVMIRFLYLVRPTGAARWRRSSSGLYPSWSVLLIAVAFVVWLWSESAGAARQTLTLAAFWDAIWPAGVGSTIAWLTWKSARATRTRRVPQIPAGDVLSPLLWVAERLARAWSRSANRYRRQPRGQKAMSRRAVLALRSLEGDWPLEQRFRRWEFSGVLYLMMLVFVFVLLAFG